MPRQRVPRTRNGGTLTEAAFWGWVRSQLRRMSQRWRPIYQKIDEGKRPVVPEDKRKWGNRIRFVYHCEGCGGYFPRKQITADHIVPCGSLKSFEDVGPFLERLLCEKEGIQRLCDDCHSIKTKQERNK